MASEVANQAVCSIRTSGQLYLDAFWFLNSELEVLVGIYVGCMLIAHSLQLLQFAQFVYSKVNLLSQTTESNFQLSSFFQHLLGKDKTF